MSVVAREVSVDETEDERDLKTSITHREKQGSRTDSYINYRIVTEVRSVYMRMGSGRMGTLGNAPSSPSLTGICVPTRTLCDWGA